MIEDRLGSKTPFFSDSDQAAEIIINELKKIKINKSIFPLSIYSFVQKLVSKNVNSGHLKKLIVFLIFFLLSRLKKFKPGSYYAQLRTTVLCYNLLSTLNTKTNEKFIITGATLIAKFPELNMTNIEEGNDELHIIKNYYQTVNQLFNEEFAFVNTLISEFRRNEENDMPALPWIQDGAKLMRLVYDFDEQMNKYQYIPEEIMSNKEKILGELNERHTGCQSEITYLFSEWSKLIPKELTLIS